MIGGDLSKKIDFLLNYSTMGDKDDIEETKTTTTVTIEEVETPIEDEDDKKD